MSTKTINDFRHLTDAKWLDMLIQSIDNPVVDNLEFPRFPSDQVQAQFVGSSRQDALREGYNFYHVAKAYAEQLGRPVGPGIAALDFGCGWGRFLRFLWKDVTEDQLHGVDIDPDILGSCRQQGVPGKLARITPMGRLPYADGSLDFILAYSVFTHLPESVFRHWMNEMKRVARPGCVFAFTIEPRRFLEFVGSLADKPTESEWHAGLQVHSPQIPQHLANYDAGKVVYLPTGGGAHRDAAIYGDAVVPLSYIKEAMEPEFRIWGHIDDPVQFWQAVVVAQRN